MTLKLFQGLSRSCTVCWGRWAGAKPEKCDGHGYVLQACLVHVEKGSHRFFHSLHYPWPVSQRCARTFLLDQPAKANFAYLPTPHSVRSGTSEHYEAGLPPHCLLQNLLNVYRHTTAVSCANSPAKHLRELPLRVLRVTLEGTCNKRYGSLRWFNK